MRRPEERLVSSARLQVRGARIEILLLLTAQIRNATLQAR